MAGCGTIFVAIFVALLSILVAQVALTPQPDLMPDLAGSIALVTGASRGIGRGIAIGLGEAGATVYITGRTMHRDSNNTGGIGGVSQVGTLMDTCEAVEQAGGKCVPVQCDSGNDQELAALFERIEKEAGRLDVLVNNAFSAVSWLPQTMGQAFWEKGVDAWDEVNHVGLRSHYHASVHAARLMVKTKSKGIIINVSSFGGLNYIFDAAYGIGKAAMDRMANDLSIELYTEGITMVSLYPGLVATENVKSGALKSVSTHRRGIRPGTPDTPIEALLPTGLAETVLYSGRAINRLARDKNVIEMTGRILPTSMLAARYGFTDERGLAPPPFISVKFIATIVLSKLGLLEIEASKILSGSGFTRFFWLRMPNMQFPSFMVKADIGAPNI